MRKALASNPNDAVARLLLGIVRAEALRQDPAKLSQEVTPLFGGPAGQWQEPTDQAAELELQGWLAQLTGQADQAKALRARALEIRQKIAEGLFPSERAPSAAPMKIGGDVTAPKLISKREPDYTRLALFARWEGGVALQTTVGIDGRPHDIRLLSGLGLGLDEQAVAAVRDWRFKPAQRKGQPVNSQATIEVNFRII